MICRLCLKRDTNLVENIINSKLKCSELTLIESLYWIFGVEVDISDPYSKFICLQCENVIRYVGSYRTVYQKNQLILEGKLDFNNDSEEWLNQAAEAKQLNDVGFKHIPDQSEIPSTAIWELSGEKNLETNDWWFTEDIMSEKDSGNDDTQMKNLFDFTSYPDMSFAKQLGLYDETDPVLEKRDGGRQENEPKDIYLTIEADNVAVEAYLDSETEFGHCDLEDSDSIDIASIDDDTELRNVEEYCRREIMNDNLLPQYKENTVKSVNDQYKWLNLKDLCISMERCIELYQNDEAVIQTMNYSKVDLVEEGSVLESSEAGNVGKITEILKMKDCISSTLSKIKHINTMKQKVGSSTMALIEKEQKTLSETNDTISADISNEKQQRRKKEVYEGATIIEKGITENVDETDLQKIERWSKKGVETTEQDIRVIDKNYHDITDEKEIKEYTEEIAENLFRLRLIGKNNYIQEEGEKADSGQVVTELNRPNIDTDFADDKIIDTDKEEVHVYLENGTHSEFENRYLNKRKDVDKGTGDNDNELHLTAKSSKEVKINPVSNDGILQIKQDSTGSIKDRYKKLKYFYITTDKYPDPKELCHNDIVTKRQDNKEAGLVKKEEEKVSENNTTAVINKPLITNKWEGDLAATVRKIREIKERLKNRKEQSILCNEANGELISTNETGKGHNTGNQWKNGKVSMKKSNVEFEIQQEASCHQDDFSDPKWVCCRKKNKMEGNKEGKKKRKNSEKGTVKLLESSAKALNEQELNVGRPRTNPRSHKKSCSTNDSISELEKVTDANQVLENLIEGALDLESEEGSPVPRIPSVFSEIDKVLFRMPPLDIETNYENQQGEQSGKQEKALINRARPKGLKPCKLRKNAKQNKSAVEERDHLAKKVEQLSKLLNLLRIIANVIDCENLMEESSQLDVPETNREHNAVANNILENSHTHTNCLIPVPVEDEVRRSYSKSLEDFLLLAELDRVSSCKNVSDPDCLQNMEDGSAKTVSIIASNNNSCLPDTEKEKEMNMWKKRVSTTLLKLQEINGKAQGSEVREQTYSEIEIIGSKASKIFSENNDGNVHSITEMQESIENLPEMNDYMNVIDQTHFLVEGKSASVIDVEDSSAVKCVQRPSGGKNIEEITVTTPYQSHTVSAEDNTLCFSMAAYLPESSSNNNYTNTSFQTTKDEEIQYVTLSDDCLKDADMKIITERVLIEEQDGTFSENSDIKNARSITESEDILETILS